MGLVHMGLEGSKGGAFPYSRRGLRLRRRGAYGIHRASGPRCQGLCRKVASHRENDSLHFVRCSAPSKCVRCASLCSGGRRLAVRKTIEYQIGALPRTPFPAARDFPSRGNERYEEKNRGVICFMYYSSISPFGGWCHHLPTSSWWDYGYLAMEPCICRKA